MATPMFKIFSRQAAKAVCRPGLRLSTLRRMHSNQTPFSGPPSYDTIARRLSLSQADPQTYFVRKRQQEAKDLGEFVDIHDISRNAKDYDVLISDIKHETLEKIISEELGIRYLSEATESQVKEVVKVGRGYIYGKTFRTIIPFVVSRNGEARWMFFIMDTSAPLTYISAQASKIFDIGENDISTATIGGHHHLVNMSPPGSHFSDLNIIGGDFCSAHRVIMEIDYVERRVKMNFIGEKHVTKESKL